jgi:hypothetical protein
LASIAAARIDLRLRSEIFSGLAHYADAPDSSSIFQRLASAQSDSIQRDLEVSVAAYFLKHSAPSKREAVAAELVHLWRYGTEPELRIAIARILGTTYSVYDREPQSAAR